jgi:cell division septation protein DedD
LAAARELGIAVAENSPRPAASRTAAAGRAGGLRLQLGAMRSETEARGAWERLKHQNSDLLGRLSAVAIRADLGGKGVYYRIQAGPVADASTADRICGELRQRHLACVIAR